MQSLVILLMVLVCFNFVLKQTWHKKWSVLAHAAAAAMFTGLMWPLAIEQSRSRISEWLSDAALMLDVSVVITLEAVIQISFCLLSAHLMNTGKVNKATVWIYRTLRWFPGLLVFPVLFSILVYMVFAFPGVSFPLVACCTAAGVFMLIAAGAWMAGKLFPEKETRLELFFLTNILTSLVAIVATVNGRTAVKGVGEVDFQALGGVIAIVAAGLAVGWASGQGRPWRKLNGKLKQR